MKERFKIPQNTGIFIFCESCKRLLIGNWCTENICQECCKGGLCPKKEKCVAFIAIKKNLIIDEDEEIIRNPSKRVR